MNDVVHGLVAGQPLVDVGDDVDADVAEQILGLVVSGLGETQEEEEREKFEHGEARIGKEFSRSTDNLIASPSL